jgi:4,5-DOPA dioxygenase extradiol
MSRLPTLFVSHGSPMTLIDPGRPGAAIAALSQRIEKPKAILIASAHWLTNIPGVSTAEKPETIHDFYGFPDELYRLTYPAPGAPDLAERAVGLLKAAGIPASGAEYGLDHGAWSPLKLMFPDADVPTAQLSIQPEKDPAHHFRVGQALAPLRDEGVLIIGSGQFTHNLRDIDRRAGEGQIADWAKTFVDWIKARIEERDFEALLDYRRQAPNAQRAHPTDEHFLPLFVALGAGAETDRIEHLPFGVTGGTLAWDSYLLH